ncbi:unnamed protein product, partial [Tuber aestivum]
SRVKTHLSDRRHDISIHSKHHQLSCTSSQVSNSASVWSPASPVAPSHFAKAINKTLGNLPTATQSQVSIEKHVPPPERDSTPFSSKELKEYPTAIFPESCEKDLLRPNPRESEHPRTSLQPPLQTPPPRVLSNRPLEVHIH